jgi:hypothetical protein
VRAKLVRGTPRSSSPGGRRERRRSIIKPKYHTIDTILINMMILPHFNNMRGRCSVSSLFTTDTCCGAGVYEHSSRTSSLPCSQSTGKCSRTPVSLSGSAFARVCVTPRPLLYFLLFLRQAKAASPLLQSRWGEREVTPRACLCIHLRTHRGGERTRHQRSAAWHSIPVTCRKITTHGRHVDGRSDEPGGKSSEDLGDEHGV